MSQQAVPTQTRFVARQPIFNRSKKAVAYELLFRQTMENVCRSGDLDQAAKGALDTAVLVGLDVLSNGLSVYVNCTRDSLLSGYVHLFPPALTVVEILENVVPDAEVVSACRELKQAGYRIALDDFVDAPAFVPLTALADIIKVDFRLSPPDARTALVRKFGGKHIQLLAEKVETHEEFSTAVEQGFTLFQGYFFCKPVVYFTQDIPSSRANYLRILQALNSPELDFVEIKDFLKCEPALYYRLFRYLNSAAFSFRGEISSISQALALLGERRVRRWLTLVCVALAGDDKPRELVTLALVRARFCELLAQHCIGAGASSFMLGLFSLLDAILDLPKEVVLKMVKAPADVQAALLGEANELRTIFELMLAFESGDWPKCEQLVNRTQMPESVLSRSHLQAVHWVQTWQLG